jgi:hypothetical protein
MCKTAIVPLPAIILVVLWWRRYRRSDHSISHGHRIAEQADRLTGGNDPIILHTLAAAYAENRQFSEAVEAAQRALEPADANGIVSLAESLRSKLALYQAETAYHDSK